MTTCLPKLVAFDLESTPNSASDDRCCIEDISSNAGTTLLLVPPKEGSNEDPMKAINFSIN
ncbi:hypothetical protein BT96DRAFT_1001785 [Gymnopus androsaceus JB14]|uniref:Uncharacterized protein n=1 Tax=Gymnopus androsaceus JB14 TaxID=1447944 RepID=A0A6A4H171_9AGAR|nr:hypothetical protein BT96DRAFT_1001785 [Gymnopus androsaceus JB14]